MSRRLSVDTLPGPGNEYLRWGGTTRRSNSGGSIANSPVSLCSYLHIVSYQKGTKVGRVGRGSIRNFRICLHPLLRNQKLPIWFIVAHDSTSPRWKHETLLRWMLWFTLSCNEISLGIQSFSDVISLLGSPTECHSSFIVFLIPSLLQNPCSLHKPVINLLVKNFLRLPSLSLTSKYSGHKNETCSRLDGDPGSKLQAKSGEAANACIGVICKHILLAVQISS